MNEYIVIMLLHNTKTLPRKIQEYY